MIGEGIRRAVWPPRRVAVDMMPTLGVTEDAVVRVGSSPRYSEGTEVLFGRRGERLWLIAERRRGWPIGDALDGFAAAYWPSMPAESGA